MNVNTVIIILAVIMTLSFIGAIWAMLKGLSDLTKKQVKISEILKNIKTPEDWIKAKEAYDQYIRDTWKKRPAEQEINHSMAGSLLKKAIELLKK